MKTVSRYLFNAHKKPYSIEILILHIFHIFYVIYTVTLMDAYNKHDDISLCASNPSQPKV